MVMLALDEDDGGEGELLEANGGGGGSISS